MDRALLLIANGFLPVPSKNGEMPVDATRTLYFGTVLGNMAYFGYVPSPDALAALEKLSADELTAFWASVKDAFKEITGANRKMDRFVVYKNFPKEVLEMSKAQYWISQILMYWGAPNHWFTQQEEVRPELKDKLSLKVLGLAHDGVEDAIFAALQKTPARWTDLQKEHALWLLTERGYPSISVDDCRFKENGILLAKAAHQNGLPVRLSTATDVLRLAAALSDGDIALRTKFKFAKFKRADRRFLLGLLDGCKNLVDDFYLRPEVWKRLLHALRPGDYQCANVSAAYDLLYRGAHKPYAKVVEYGLRVEEPAVLDWLKTRPGDFMRRLHKAYAVFGRAAADAFVAVVPSLTTMQLLKLDGYLATINWRKQMIYAPKGQWAKAQIAPNSKVKIVPGDLNRLRNAISHEIRNRLSAMFPEGFAVDPAAAMVTLQTNDQELASYGRGTVFPIPENVTFIRTASYWETKTVGSNWFDNGWNFFDANWNAVGTCCWNHTHDMGKGAVFSGDPTNAKDLKGRACQMIDLYPEHLLDRGVRYAVWNVLCFSKIKFSEAGEVLATLQWGEDAEAGKLFEPSRAQMVFPLKGDCYTKYVAVVDLVARELIFIDGNLRSNVQSAGYNTELLSATMPAFMEYVKALPTVGDLFGHGDRGSIPVVYNDEGRAISGPAYVFQRRNAANEFAPIDLAKVLEGEKAKVAAR